MRFRVRWIRQHLEASRDRAACLVCPLLQDGIADVCSRLAWRPAAPQQRVEQCVLPVREQALGKQLAGPTGDYAGVGRR